MVCIRSFQLTQKASKMEYKAIESVLQTLNPHTGEVHLLFCFSFLFIPFLAVVAKTLDFSWIISTTLHLENSMDNPLCVFVLVSWHMLLWNFLLINCTYISSVYYACMRLRRVLDKIYCFSCRWEGDCLWNMHENAFISWNCIMV